MGQAITLNTAQRKEFLGQLAQMFIDSLSKKMQDGGDGAKYSDAFNNVRKTVNKHRAERYQKRKLLPISDPQAAAMEKKAKNRRKLDSKKRKTQDLIVSKRGALGSARVKKSRTLV